MNFSQIIRIEDGKLYFSDEMNEKSIDLRKSANILYESVYKESVIDKLLRKRNKNIYAGIKNYNIDGMASITLFEDDKKYVFEMDINETNQDKQTEIWNDINCKLNRQGFWLLDWR